MKSAWHTQPFEDCIEQVTYTQKIQRQDFLDHGAYPIVSQEEDFVNGYWDNEADLFKVTTPIVVFGDHTKVLKYVDFDFVLGADGVKILQPREFLLPKFFFYQLQTANLDSLGYARHYRLLKELAIAYPGHPEQQRIVGILDEAFDCLVTARANAERNLRNARALFESQLQSIFTERGEGWVEKRLGNISRINYGYTESASPEMVGPKFLRITDIQDNKVDWSSVPYCPIEASDYPKYKLADGDIVFARTGATTGKSYLVADPPESVCASYLIRVQVDRAEMLPPFVNLFFQTQAYWDNIRTGVSGSAQGGFNATKLGELVIPFPRSKADQQSIVAKLDAISAETQHLESLYQRKLAALDRLKKSLLHQAFTGNL
jgi:type I restriction enzyme S subunit